MNGTVTVIDKGAVRDRTYTAPDDSVNVTTQLIETPAWVIAVDAQFVLAYADEVATYVKGLGKPLDRVIITHAHPTTTTAPPASAPRSTRWRPCATRSPPRATARTPLARPCRSPTSPPTVVINPGTEVIDGVPFVFEAHAGGEATDELVVKLPEQGVLVAQDLVYHHVHLFLGNNDIAGWQQAVDKLAADDAYDTVLAGHGLPAGPEVYAELRRYLTDAGELLGDDGDAYKKAIIDRYPSYGGPFLIDIANRYLFGAGH